MADDGRIEKKTAGEKARPADVREALLAAALRLIETLPEDRVSLRACARLAGVSHAAPAHYFPSRAALMSAVLARAFDTLTAAMEAARDAAGDDPHDRLKATGLAYVDFGLSRPALYRMMFQTAYLQIPDSMMAQSGAVCRAVLHDAVATTPRPGGMDIASGMALAWTAVHGIVALVGSGMIVLEEPPLALTDRILSAQREAFSGA